MAGPGPHPRVLAGACLVLSLTAAPARADEPEGGTTAVMVSVLLGLLLAASVVLLLRIRQSIHRMTQQHEQTLRSLTSRRNELEATLSSMVEGVLAVDGHQRVITLNKAAADLLNLRQELIVGRPVADTIPSKDLQAFIAQTLETDGPIQADLELPSPSGQPDAEPQMYQVQGAVLHDTDHQRTGSLIVLHNVTRLRRLEVMRRDFVANASHEIKTPITAIKAAAETLQANQGQDPEATDQFLGVIARQADRLSALIEDLLSLTRMEEDTNHQNIELNPGAIADVLQVAAEACAAKIQDRQAHLTIECDEGLMVPINAPLLEQAVVNLLDNAIKYSDPDSAIAITAVSRGGQAIISVQDEGAGIAAEHLPRIFERFYRTDKARSRALGGTGLGLSIVKHIALSHGGDVSVESTPKQGSAFRIHLPLT